MEGYSHNVWSDYFDRTETSKMPKNIICMSKKRLNYVYNPHRIILRKLYGEGVGGIHNEVFSCI